MKGITIETDIVEHFSVFHAWVLKARNRNVKGRLTTVTPFKESHATAFASAVVKRACNIHAYHRQKLSFNLFEWRLTEYCKIF